MAQLDEVFAQERYEDGETGLARLLKRIVTVLNTPCAVSLLRIMHQIVGSREPSGALSNQEEQRSTSILAKHLMAHLGKYFESQMTRGILRPVKAGLTAYLITSILISTIVGRGQSHRIQPSHEELAEMIATLYCYGLLPREEQTDTT